MKNLFFLMNQVYKLYFSILLFPHYFDSSNAPGLARLEKQQQYRYVAVRETGVFKHLRAQLRAPLKPPKSQNYRIEGLKGCPKLGTHHFADRH